MNSYTHCTHPALHIRHAQDAHKVFEAVRNGILPLIRRRLTPTERDLLASGQVFVWEEASSATTVSDDGTTTASGLERWTDGRRWSQSRMREPFLFYEEKVQTTPEEKQAKAERRARKYGVPASPSSPDGGTGPMRRQDRPSKPNGLTKQTYSSYVQVTPRGPPKKWHCVAYFISVDFNTLPVIESYPYLRDLPIPEGIYINAKGSGRVFSTPNMGICIEPATTSGPPNVFYGRRPPGSGDSVSSGSTSNEDGRAHLVPMRPSGHQQYGSSSSTSSASTSGNRSPATPGRAEHGYIGLSGAQPPSSFRHRVDSGSSNTMHRFPSYELSKSQTTITPTSFNFVDDDDDYDASSPQDVEMQDDHDNSPFRGENDYRHQRSQFQHSNAPHNTFSTYASSRPNGKDSAHATHYTLSQYSQYMPVPPPHPSYRSTSLLAPLSLPSTTIGVHGRSSEDVKALRAFKVSL